MGSTLVWQSILDIIVKATNPTSLSELDGLSATTVGDYALFAGGY